MRTITTLAIDSWKIFKTNWSLLILIQLVVTLALFLVSFLFKITNLLPPQDFFKNPSLNFTYISEILLITLATSLIALWGSGATVFVIAKDKTSSFKQAYKKGFEFFWFLFTTGLIFFLAVSLGLGLLVVPGVIFAVWFSMYIFVVVEEGLIGWKALGRSRELVKGNWWKVFNRWTFVFTALVAIDLFASIVPLVRLFAGLFTGPFFLIYGYLIYRDLKSAQQTNK